MHDNRDLSRRRFLAVAGTAFGAVAMGQLEVGRGVAAPVSTAFADVAALRRDMVSSPLRVALHRAKTFTRVFQETEGQPWIVRKATALREYFRTVPLYVRPHDRLAGSISELPGAMPIIVEMGIGENGIYTGERPDREGYLKGQVPEEIREYWKNRNAWGQFRTQILGQRPYGSADEVPRELSYKFISNQGHLSPDYGELLHVGLDGVLARVRRRQRGETDAGKRTFFTAVKTALTGLSEWIGRYADFLAGESIHCDDAACAADLREMSRIARKVAAGPPETFREAMQLLWFVHQAIHVEGHGYSCTPGRIDQLLLPFYEADRKAGRIDDREVLRLAENFALKQYDNSFWGSEHHLTQGLCLGGSNAEGQDQTNRLSWLFVEGATNLSLPEPLIWIRWHPNVNQEFFDFKETDPLLHTRFTGFGNGGILANLRRLHAAGAKIVLRCPMIPQYNARKQHLDGIAAVAGELPALEGVELLPYYDFWRTKLKRFGLVSALPESVRPPDPSTVQSWIDYLRRGGVRVLNG